MSRHSRKSSNIIDSSKNSNNNIETRNRVSEPKFYEQYVKKKEMQLLLNE